MLKRLSLIIAGILTAVNCYAATLLPNGEQVFLDDNGSPLSIGKVYFYIPGTTTPKNTYQDSGGTILNTNPIILDAGGRAVIYGSGTYREVVVSNLGVTIWDQLTADSSGGGTSSGGTSGGTQNAQTVSVSSFSGQNGQQITFRAGLTNTGAMTLTPTGSSATPVLKDTLAGPVALSGGEVVTGNEYTVTYDTTAGAFHLGFYPINSLNITGNIATTANISSTSANVAGTTTTGGLSVGIGGANFANTVTITNGGATITGASSITGAATITGQITAGASIHTGGATVAAPFAGTGNIAVPIGTAIRSVNAVSAYGNFTSPGTVNYGFNVASIVNGGTGIYTVTFAATLNNANTSTVCTSNTGSQVIGVTNSNDIGFVFQVTRSDTAALINFSGAINCVTVGGN